MSVESDLRKDGIEVIKKLDTQKVNSIAKNVSYRICNTFPNFNLNQKDLFIKLSNLDMYIADMPEGLAEANYFYKNTSIYFNSHIPYEDLEEFAIHECIHYIQERKDKKNYLLRMGLCDYTEFKIYGLGLNEAAVQLMTSKILGIPKEYVKYFNISFETTSPSYYPLECCLVNQLAYIVGEDILFESTINTNNNFKQIFTELTNYKTFMQIQNSIDNILYYEEEIIRINNKILQIDEKNKKVTNMQKKINSLKNNITSTFISTQNLIISSFFDKEFNNIHTLKDIDNYRKKLYNFKDYLGSDENYNYFNNYYVNKMEALEEKADSIESENNSLYLTKNKESKFLSILQNIKNFFIKNTLKHNTDENKN